MNSRRHMYAFKGRGIETLRLKISNFMDPKKFLSPIEDNLSAVYKLSGSSRQIS